MKIQDTSSVGVLTGGTPLALLSVPAAADGTVMSETGGANLEDIFMGERSLEDDAGRLVLRHVAHRIEPLNLAGQANSQISIGEIYLSGAALLYAYPEENFSGIVINPDSLVGMGTSGLVFAGEDGLALKVFHNQFEIRESRRLAYACAAILRSLGLPVVEVDGGIQVQMSRDFSVANGVSMKADYQYDGFRMNLLDKEHWVERFSMLDDTIKPTVLKNLEHIREVLAENGLGYSGNNIQCMYNRRTGDVVLIDPAELEIFNAETFHQKYLPRFPRVRITRYESEMERFHRERRGDPAYDEWIGSD